MILDYEGQCITSPPRRLNPEFRLHSWLPLVQFAATLPWYGRGARFDPNQVHQFTQLSLTGRVVEEREAFCLNSRRYSPFTTNWSGRRLRFESGWW